MKKENEILLYNWKFLYEDVNLADQKSYDDSNWKDVFVPHDWSIEQSFSEENSSGTGYLPNGVGFYRCHFSLPKEFEGKKVFVKFDGVYNNSMTWCNSYYMGKKAYGYSEFVYDITDFACFGENKNVISVKVNHKDVGDSRWFTGSGIYRKVAVIVKEKTYIDNYGVFVDSFNINGDVKISTTVINNDKKDVSVRQTIFDSENNICCKTEQKCNETNTINQSLNIQTPNLWSIENPYLYTCKTQILCGEKVLDEEITLFGVRSIRFDKDLGFFLNEKNVKFKGVCVHHDGGCLGAAVRKDVWKRRLNILKNMGCNSIRMSHNPHMPELFELCDEMGFLVIDEAFDEWEGVKNKWVKGHNVYPPSHKGYYEDFPKDHEVDLKTLILRDRNHPCVVLWSIGNEIDYPNDPYCHPLFKTATGNNDKNKPESERIYSESRPNAERLTHTAKKLYNIVKKYDLTRPVTAALAFPELSNPINLAGVLDVVGYNYKEHLYKENHEKYPDHILMGSENGKELSMWKAVVENDFISGQFLWTGIDFLGETVGWPCHGSEAGLITTAGFEKPFYYFRKSLWTDEPFVKAFAHKKGSEINPFYSHELSTDWNFSDGDNVCVVCFSNLETVDVYINNQKVKTLTKNEEGYFADEIKFSSGELKCVGAKNGVETFDILKTVGVPAKIKLFCDKSKVVANSLDVAQISVELLDSNENFVYNSDNILQVNILENGKVLGIDSGNLWDTTPFSLTKFRCYNGRMVIYVVGTNVGNIEITVSGLRLKDDTINLSCIL